MHNYGCIVQYTGPMPSCVLDAVLGLVYQLKDICLPGKWNR